MENLLLFVILGIIVAGIARNKGRSGLGWFFYGALLFPVALVHALLLERTRQNIEYRARRAGRLKCPHCAEFVKSEAKTCPFCQRDLVFGWQAPLKNTPQATTKTEPRF